MMIALFSEGDALKVTVFLSLCIFVFLVFIVFWR